MDEAQEASNMMQKYCVARHRYDEASKKFGCMICFFEGDHDKDYYKSHIRTICGDIIDIPCHCKANVLKMYKNIHSSDHNKYRLAYFIDRDFDDLVNNPDIFETDGYSIENYYCSKEAFSRYITDFLYIEQNSDDYNRSMDFYTKEYEASHSVIAEFNHYYSAIKRAERNGGNRFTIEAGNSFPYEFGTIGVNQYNKNYSLESLNRKYGSNITADDIERERNWLDSNPHLYYRGKYEMQELEDILNYLIKEAAGQRGVPKEHRIIRKNPKVACLPPGKLLLHLSSMADVTQKLRDYLNRFVAQDT